MSTLVKHIEKHAHKYPGKTALIIDDRALTYGDLELATNRVANALRATGLQRGDRVSLYMHNSLEYVISVFGIAKAGGVANPLNSMLKESELEFIMQNAGSRILITTDELYGTIDKLRVHLPLLETVIVQGQNTPSGTTDFYAWIDSAETEFQGTRPAPEDSMYLCYSSGTTGVPKGIVHTHASATAQAALSANHLHVRPPDKMIHALPLFHLFGGNIILGASIVAGATLIVHKRFDAERILRDMCTYKATMLAGVPTMFAYLIHLDPDVIRKYPVHDLEVGVCAGAPLPVKVSEEFLRLFGARIINCFGITEAAGNLIGMLRYVDQPAGCSGVPYPCTEIRCVDTDDRPLPPGEVGEIIAKGPQIMKEYWNLPDETNQTLRGGFLHTGDLGWCDEHGFIHVVDRAKDMIISGGFNIYPSEVENFIVSHPKVAQCAVFAVEDDLKGEVPWAAVVPKPDEVLSEAEVIQYCREHMAVYKAPRHVVIVDSLPISSVGKVLRRILRDTYRMTWEG